MSESVDFQLLFLGQPNLDQEITDVDPLVSLQLQHLSILGVLHHRTIAGKLLGGEKEEGLGVSTNCTSRRWASLRVAHEV